MTVEAGQARESVLATMIAVESQADVFRLRTTAHLPLPLHTRALLKIRTVPLLAVSNMPDSKLQEKSQLFSPLLLTRQAFPLPPPPPQIPPAPVSKSASDTNPKFRAIESTQPVCLLLFSLTYLSLCCAADVINRLQDDAESELTDLSQSAAADTAADTEEQSETEDAQLTGTFSASPSLPSPFFCYSCFR